MSEKIVPESMIPLCKLFDREEPKILIVVGSGVSTAATKAPQASWRGLLEHGIDHLERTNRLGTAYCEELRGSLRDAFNPFNLELVLQHAENIQNILKTPSIQAFSDWLGSAFRGFKAEPDRTEILEAIRDLKRAGALLLTTNYDSLLSDFTGLPPVTWEEPDSVLRVINRQQEGVLHIHGHWQKPTSIILGSASYSKILGREKIQSAMKSLWLEWSWVYVGCGNGLDDPNLGGLLEWGKQWGNGALPDYFLAREDEAIELSANRDKPANLVCVGFRDFQDLPKVLRGIAPAARCSPFIAIDDKFASFRSPSSSSADIPFPSRQEYLNGEVPALQADSEVMQRLAQFNWAFVLDVSSVGKTTLALRVAASEKYRDYLAFYLDLAIIGDGDECAGAASSLRRLSRPKTLIILDNIHHQPELARQLWDQWRNNQCDSVLLLIGTRVQRRAITAPSQDLAFFEHDSGNPAVALQPCPEDLRRIVQCIHKRIMGNRAAKTIDPPPYALSSWHKLYGHALGAFCIAVLSRLGDFGKGDWSLPASAAAEWVREKWLKNLSDGSKENLICLSVFAAQKFEMTINREALPYPDETGQILDRGLALRNAVGLYGQYLRYSLREPDWGELILAAQTAPVDESEVLFKTATRHPFMAVMLTGRIKRTGDMAFGKRLWAYLAADTNLRLSTLLEIPLLYVANYIDEAESFGQHHLAERCWNVVETVPERLHTLNYGEHLGRFTKFLETAERHKRDVTSFWKAIESEPAKLVERAWETPLDFLGGFLDAAKAAGRDTEILWAAVESDPDRFAQRALGDQLGLLTRFLGIAKRHKRDVISFWKAIEREPSKLVERAWETPLDFLGGFLDAAREAGRDTEILWAAVESDPVRFAQRALGDQLGQFTKFLEIAKRHKRDVTSFWKAIESEPAKLVERAWETPFDFLGGFLDAAREAGRDTEILWAAVESDPDRFAQRALGDQLGQSTRFLETAKRHKRDVTSFWEAIESEPAKLIERAWETPFDFLGGFLDAAREAGRDTEILWAAIESNPDRFAQRALSNHLGQFTKFLETAKRHKRDVTSFWEAIEREPSKLIKTVSSETILAIAYFMRFAPEPVLRRFFTSLLPGFWKRKAESQPLQGAVWIAARCEELGFEDQKAELIELLLHRRGAKNFFHNSSLVEVAWLLSHCSQNEETEIKSLLDTLCTKEWLDYQYMNEPCGPLAGGLRTLALNQPPAVLKRFLDYRDIVARLRWEFSIFSKAKPERQSAMVQFLGCAVLCGCRVHQDIFMKVSPSAIARLPVDILPHSPEATKVESWQFQLWLGLRAFIDATGEALDIDDKIVVKTLELLRENMADSAMSGNSAEQKAYKDLYDWIESCARSGPGRLTPDAARPGPPRERSGP